MNAILGFGPTVLIFIAILALLVLVHELGHFLFARLFGIEVEEFGFGFPPRLAGFKTKKGKTLWSLNWIPLGGFVRIRGEDDPSVKGPGSFSHRGAAVRSLVISAGVLMNLLLASVLFSSCYLIGLPQIADELPANAKARDFRIQIIEVLQGTPAEKAGILPGDTILSIDGKTFDDVTPIQAYVDSRDSNPVEVRLGRGKQTLDLKVTPQVSSQTGKHVMGVALVRTAIVSYPIHVAIGRGFAATGYYVKEIFVSVGELIRGLFVRQTTNVEFAGPVGIAVLTGRVAKLGFVYLLQFAALLSVNLAVINILPIPALDGGRLLFIVIERFRGRAVRPKLEVAIHKIAFILLLFLALLVTLKDLDRYKEQILQALKSLFGVT